jgi:hypothetical protein
MPPVAVGGVGGSGTRLIAEILRHLGYYIGGDLNESADNLWFTLLFKRTELWAPETDPEAFDRAVHIFRSVMVDRIPMTDAEVTWLRDISTLDRPQHDAAWLRARADSLVRAAAQPSPPSRWGWKEPNTHVFLDRLAIAFPGMRYVHVMRNGLDMAHSSNQNQLNLWGRFFLRTSDCHVDPRWSLKYWCAVHRRVLAIAQSMPGRFLLLNYDDLCSAPQAGLRLLLTFLGERVDRLELQSLQKLVRTPDSKGRFKQSGGDIFDVEDVAYVKSLGFET